jgi:hypothetical protein
MEMFDSLMGIGLIFGCIGTACVGYKCYIYKKDYLELKSNYSNMSDLVHNLSERNTKLKDILNDKKLLKFDKSTDTLDIESNDLTPKFEIYDLTPKPSKIQLILKDNIKSNFDEDNSLKFIDTSVQTDKNMVDRSVQTELDKEMIDLSVQTDKNMNDKSVQTDYDMKINKFVQSDDEYNISSLIEIFNNYQRICDKGSEEMSKNYFNIREFEIINEFLLKRFSKITSQDLNQMNFILQYFKDLENIKSFVNPSEPFTPKSIYLNDDNNSDIGNLRNPSYDNSLTESDKYMTSLLKSSNLPYVTLLPESQNSVLENNSNLPYVVSLPKSSITNNSSNLPYNTQLPESCKSSILTNSSNLPYNTQLPESGRNSPILDALSENKPSGLNNLKIPNPNPSSEILSAISDLMNI